MTTNSDSPGAPRLKAPSAASATWAALSQLQLAANRTQLDARLLELVKMRASQLNRCAFCLDLHARTAVAHGETPGRLHVLPAWEEVTLFSPRERAALRWAEAVTRLAGDGVSDAVFAEVSAHFSESELLELTLAVIAINSWNRLNVAFRVAPDPNYWPGGKAPAADAAAREKVAPGAAGATVRA
jgi:AhpD family alkylhydroperoxidase